MPKSYPYITPTREETLLLRYGECITKAGAARILGCNEKTIRTMTRDGRLETVCEGKKVSVRSIARYMETPAQENYKASLRRRGKDPSRCIVPAR